MLNYKNKSRRGAKAAGKRRGKIGIIRLSPAAPSMESPVDIKKLTVGDMGVNLGCADV